MEYRTSPMYKLGDDQSFELQFSSPNFDSNLLSPLSSTPKYQRISPDDVDTQYHGAQSPDNSNQGDLGQSSRIGLGLGDVTGRRTPSVQRVPVGSKGTPTSAGFLLSPTSTRVGVESPEYDKRFEHRRNTSGTSSGDRRSQDGSEIEHLTSKDAGISGTDSDLPFPCKSRRHIHHKRGDCLSISILILALYSTVFSAIWLIIALVKPRYGTKIGSSGGLSPSTASTITAAIAKTIELSYVTVFVAFLGQMLTRRAIAKGSKGVSVADLSLRSWVVQPGTLITHWESVRYGGTTLLGGIAIFAAISSTTYTTASDALVSPNLRMGSVKHQLLAGHVSTSWANPFYVQDTCQTPIPTALDPDNAATTCIEIEFAGQAFSNWITYLSTWAEVVASGNGSSNLASRPPPVATLYDNTTVTGSWIDLQYNMTETSLHFNRTVNNISMAMPHAGVFAAARDPINKIMQPQDLSGFGEYFLGASVPSPVINVLCAAVTTEELAPLVYKWWPNAANQQFNSSTWPNGYGIPAKKLNSTPVDDLFGFGEKYGREPPVFGIFPQPYNTVLNSTAGGYNADALYVLAASAIPDQYMLCSLSASLTTNCSTLYHGSRSSGSLSSICNDPEDSLTYIKSYPNATNGIRSGDWVNVATDWGLAINLDGGVSNNNAAVIRLLTQLIPTSPVLSRKLPSIAEGLAVLAGVTSLLSTLDAPFVHFFNYSAYENLLETPEIQLFNSTLQYQDYSSGGSHSFQYVFYVVLILVFFMNFSCLVLLIIFGGLLTDISELGNLFAMSLNSPPSDTLAGACGGGPEGQEYQAKWAIAQNEGHFWIESKGTQIKKPKGAKTQEEIYKERQASYSELSQRTGWI